MEDLKQAILSMMAEKLEDGLKQMEKSATNSKAEQTNEQPESSKNQQLLHDLKHNKEENMLQFEKIQKETEAINIKISQLELKMSEMEPKNYKQSHQESQEKLHVCDNDKLNQKCDDVNWLRTELETKAAICRNQEFKISQLQEDLKCQEQLNLRKVYKYRKELEEKDDLCYQLEQKVAQARGNPQHLLDKLKGQAEIHLREVNELRKELEAKDNICHQLEVEVTQVRENPEFIRMRQLLDEHKSQVYLLSCEVSELRKELEVKDNICHQLENEVIQARENPQLLKLVEDLKNQENLYVHEINELRNELEVKDDICHQLEDQVIQVRESPEFIEMRQQLLDDLKAQEERHLGESNELRQELEAKITKCEETEQELEQLRDRHNLSVSCPICMEPWDSSNHRLVALTCGHLFGETCVRESLQRNPTCPECRANVSTNDIRQLFARC